VLVASGQTTLVFVDEAKRKPVKPPEWFLDLLRPYFK
jgi:acyl-CoA thioesterase FadM